MNIKILEKTKKELKIEIDGANHTLCNVIQKQLVKDERVDLAGYNILHPLISNPVIYVRTKGKNKPETILKKNVKQVQTDTQTFRAAFDKALQAWQETHNL